ncbi:hypothetical protein Tco_0072639 [Tanacetum coccineum]
MIASSKSRNSSKNMQRFSSNDMVQNYYLEKAKKKTQEKDMNSKSSVIHFARLQSTADGSKPKPGSTNQSTRSFPASKSSYVTITVVPITDHSKNSNSFSDPKHFVCSTCHKCVFNANHDACITKLLKEVNSRAKIQSHKTKNSNKPVDQKSHTQKPGRWQPIGRNIKTVGLKWIPAGKLLDSCTGKVESTSLTVQQKQRINFSAVVSKSSAVTTTDASDKRQQQPDSTSSTSTLATSVTADGNFDL